MFATSRRDQFLVRNRRQKKETGTVKPLLKNGLNSLKLNNTSAGAGPRTFYFLDSLAMLEQALIDYALDKLIEQGFCMVSVPEVLPLSVIEACGFPVDSERDQIYKIVQEERHGPEMALAGTSEMTLAAFCAGRNLGFEEEGTQEGTSTDVLGLCAASKCFRREVSTVESTLYRTHQFNKVEMFCVTQPSLMVSDAMFERMLRLQIDLLSGLNLHFRVMEMPSSELGLSAFRKVDIEVWMPAEKFFGEVSFHVTNVSSTSNCTDYQSRRLQITWSDQNNASNDSPFAHTVGQPIILVYIIQLNGTACAVPRLMKAIIETHQQADNSVLVPEALQPYMDGMKHIRPNRDYEMEWITKLKK
ncbi:seryl-tRNA synthetase [Cichlidogyrus casuarinus]|uniref:serine--tRNA ligase n=1 Tax=Cichlidogyrus casuarinus TaxID=1844966 RepID=A0ABD2QHK4_9PLAT